MPQPVRTITDMNDLVFAQFERITATRNHLVFPIWWAQRQREVIALQCPEYSTIAAARWANLKRDDQHGRLLGYLASFPDGAGAAAKTTSYVAIYNEIIERLRKPRLTEVGAR